jgi:hypothetical protein
MARLVGALAVSVTAQLRSSACDLASANHLISLLYISCLLLPSLLLSLACSLDKTVDS